MRLQPASIAPHVRALPPKYRRAVSLEVGPLAFELTASEAHELADRLVDATENRKTATGRTRQTDNADTHTHPGGTMFDQSHPNTSTPSVRDTFAAADEVRAQAEALGLNPIEHARFLELADELETYRHAVKVAEHLHRDGRPFAEDTALHGVAGNVRRLIADTHDEGINQ